MADLAIASVGATPHDWRRLWIVPPVIVLLVLFFYPLSLIFRQAFDVDGATSLSAFADIIGSRQFHRALINTIAISLGATTGCLVLGFIFSTVIAFIPFPGARFCGRLIETFISLPTFLVTLAFTFIYGSAGILNTSLMQLFGLDLPPVDFLYSRWGVILAEMTVYTPFVMRPLLATFSLLEMSQIEVASSLGARPMRIVRKIIFPAALPALLTGGSLCLLLTVNEFGIVLFIGARDVITLPMMIYGKAIQEFDYTAACVIAVFNVALSLALYSLYRVVITYFGDRDAGLV